MVKNQLSLMIVISLASMMAGKILVKMRSFYNGFGSLPKWTASKVDSKIINYLYLPSIQEG